MTQGDNIRATNRQIVLFPGAFRPPHKAHFETVRSLASRTDIDEVIVIIANRYRQVPGTHLGLAPSVASKIWAIYLGNYPKVRVEIATTSAVKHALGYFAKVSPSDKLLFCAGQNELGADGGRFRKIADLSQQHGVSASIIAAPGSPLAGGATRLRGFLALGEPGHEPFLGALPDHLTLEQKVLIWRICQDSLEDLSQATIQRTRELFERKKLGSIEKIEPIQSGKKDAAIVVHLQHKRKLFVKSAHDTPKAAGWNDLDGLKPRQRVYAERRALKWLTRQSFAGLELPAIIDFDNRTRTLVTAEVGSEGISLQRALKEGRFDPRVAREVTRFLGQCHAAVQKVPPFWGSKAADFRHWRTILNIRTVGLAAKGLDADAVRSLEALEKSSLEGTREGFFHLDLSPKNLFVKASGIGLIDFELSSSVGDPACDLGFFLGHYLYWGKVHAKESLANHLLQNALASYRQAAPRLWPAVQSRVMPFAGVCLLSLGMKPDLRLLRKIKPDQ